MRVWTWIKAHWLDVLLALTGVGLAVLVGRAVMAGTRVPAPAQGPATVPDAGAPLAPLAEAEAAVNVIEDTTRAAAARDQAEMEDAHAAIDAADTVDDVDVVLYGRRHSTVPGGGPAPAPDGGAGAPPGAALPGR